MLNPPNYDDSSGLEQQSFKTKLSSLSFKYDNSHTNLKNLCIQHVPFWNDLNHESLEVKTMMNGVTNQVHMVTLTPPYKDRYPLKSVCIKKSTTYNSLAFDNDVQYNVAKLLGDNNFGPKIIGRFGDFTIQEWVEGDVMEIESLRNISVLTGIASSLAKFHKRVTELVPKEWDRTPTFLTKISLWSQHVERIIKKHNMDFDYNEMTQNFELFKKILTNHLNSSNSIANSVMFCHNDLFFTNILEFNQGIYFIDFDFAGFNYVGWEIASFFRIIYIVYDPLGKYLLYHNTPPVEEEFKPIFLSVYLSQLLGKNVSPSDDVVKEFLQSLEIHSLGVYFYSTYLGIIMYDKLNNEVSKPTTFDHFAIFQYNLFKSLLSNFSDSKM
ncbi:Choline/ethanolamine kinase family protein [Theileria parva strain Muguga]|uniref:Choline kinase, putative n=1 Tax=Theileria parva TaxID=5875 RepID=Q4N4I0_THEPA|nr:Choline/ethanolamine kinase family protein [Theileria parva strain Muguga]EAN32943.1 Choline/ethanolamine kinase family protein [Theileria parva strain Muguga]|eukprot:XP_765226.1 choline kinase [Theileria parva strain Muguga]